MNALGNGSSPAGRNTAAIAALVTMAVLAGCAGTGPLAVAGKSAERHELKDGTTLLADANGGMRMYSPAGSAIHMKDGVPMETRDGTVIVMKENVLWKQLREFGTLSPKSR